MRFKEDTFTGNDFRSSVYYDNQKMLILAIIQFILSFLTSRKTNFIFYLVLKLSTGGIKGAVERIPSKVTKTVKSFFMPSPAP